MEKTQILIAEDERIVAKDVRNMLERMGYVVPAVVSSGAEAIDRAAELQPDLVLMDIMLKGDMDGVEAAEQIRRRFHIPVVYVTAYADEDTMQRAKITDPYGYILKPFQNRELSIAVEMALYRHKAEERLLRSEERYRILVNNANEIILVAQDGILRFVNPKAIEFMGYSEHELTSRPFIEFVHPDDRDMVMQRHMKRLRGEEVPGVYSLRVIDKDGTVKWAEVNAVLITWENRPATLNFLSDITERKEMQDALRESEELYRTLVNTAPEAVVETNLEGYITYASPRTPELNGYESAEELLGMSAFELIAPQDHERAMKNLQKTLEAGTLRNLDYTLLRKDGSSFTGELSTTLIRDANGMPKSFMAIIRDVTSRRQMEEELAKIQRLESLGILASGIAHDFNNYLTAILGNISLARIYEDPEARDKRLMEAEKASMRVKGLTEQLLTFSRGGMPIKKLVAVGDILRDSASFVLSGSNVRCELSIPDDLWAGEMDPGQISQVINNLIINANQAMPEGGAIKVTAENVVLKAEEAIPLEEGEYVKISVIDQGVGIPEEHLQRIFDPFFTTKKGGSGLGLATSYSIIRKHGGHISVESQVGVGTTFRIYLPVSHEDALVKEYREQMEAEKPVAGRGRILVMDDEELVRELITNMLGRMGYEITTTIDGAQAINSYRKARESGEPYDAVIIDLTIPGGMGGKEAIQKLIEIDPEINAIVSSGYSNDPVMSNFAEYGFKDVIPKPYSAGELNAVLHRVIAG